MITRTAPRIRNRRPVTQKLLEHLESRTLLSISSVAAPSNLAATLKSPTAVQLNWTDNDSTALGYYIFRSTDRVHFSQLAKITGASSATFIDASALSGHLYYYAVEAYSRYTYSDASNFASATTPLVAPSNLALTVSGASLTLSWTPKDSYATGYSIYRSTNGSSFSLLTQINSLTTTSYSDSAITAGKTYAYKILAFNTITASAFSSPVSAVAPSPTPAPGPTPSPPTTGTVTITTRYSNELVVTGSSASDTILVTQSGSTLTITADGTTSSYAVPAAGLFIYTRGGVDSITIGASVLLRTTIESIDGAATTISSAGANVSAWIDSTDSITGTAKVHAVATFAGGVSKAMGAALANPSDSGPTMTVSHSLWGTGPVVGDVNQGELGDCYFLSTLAGFAGQSPAKLLETAVDMGDGTFVVQFKSTFIRVSNTFSTGPFSGYKFAQPGTSGTLWALVLEKAFAFYRNGSNTYASIEGGWMSEVYSDLGTASTSPNPSSYTDANLHSLLSNDLASGKPVTLGTKSSGTTLVSDHAYTLTAVTTVGGVNYYTVRNPWGVSGDSLENSQGYATLTYAQLLANFSAFCQAS